jgi:hypothetical protein
VKYELKGPVPAGHVAGLLIAGVAGSGVRMVPRKSSGVKGAL